MVFVITRKHDVMFFTDAELKTAVCGKTCVHGREKNMFLQTETEKERNVDNFKGNPEFFQIMAFNLF